MCMCCVRCSTSGVLSAGFRDLMIFVLLVASCPCAENERSSFPSRSLVEISKALSPNENSAATQCREINELVRSKLVGYSARVCVLCVCCASVYEERVVRLLTETEATGKGRRGSAESDEQHKSRKGKVHVALHSLRPHSKAKTSHFLL